MGRLLRGIGESFRRGHPRLWGAALLILLGFSIATYLDYLSARTGGLALAVGTGLLRLLIAQLGMAALYKAVLRPEQPLWHIDSSTLRFICGSLAIFGFIAGFMILGRLWVNVMTESLDLAGQPKLVFRIVSFTIIAVLLSCAFLRTQPWLAALATGRRDVTLGRSWSETAGNTLPLVAVWLLLVLPLMLANLILSIVAAIPAAVAPPHLGFATLEAAGVTAIAVATALLNATLLRWIDGELEA